MSRTDRCAVVHIGVIKTGSTAIQACLQAMRQPLKALGAHYAQAFGARQHAPLAEALRGAANGAASPSARAVLERMLGAFAQELAALPGGVDRVILSSEHFSGLPDAAVALLKAALDPHAARARVIVYLRRQDEFAVSRFSNMIRSGQALRSPMEVPPPHYDVLLERWGRVFGEAALEPRIYAPERLVGGEAVSDFLHATGLAALPRPPTTERPNPNLHPAGLGLLRRVNARMQALGVAEDEADRLRNHLAGILQQHFPGSGELPSRQEAINYLARCEASNEKVRRRWFPDQPSLFPMDFTRYPTTPTLGPTLEELLDVAVRGLIALEPLARRPNDGPTGSGRHSA